MASISWPRYHGLDIMAFFDKENIYDVMQTLSDIGVNKKAARVWFKPNEGTERSVKTAAGMSDIAQVGDCIGQGTAGAALVSQVNLDQGLLVMVGRILTTARFKYNLLPIRTIS